MRISDWSSDVCSSDLIGRMRQGAHAEFAHFNGRDFKAVGIEVDEADVGAGACETQHGRAAEAGGSAGDECGLAVHVAGGGHDRLCRRPAERRVGKEWVRTGKFWLLSST